MRWAALLIAVSVALPAGALAQDGEAMEPAADDSSAATPAAPTEGAPSTEAIEAALGATGEASEADGERAPLLDEPVLGESLEEEPWTGPSVELGYSYFVLPDGQGAGDVHGGFFGGYLPFEMWLRVGLAAEAGARSYALGPDDILLRGTLVAGYQHLGLGRFLPYAVLVGTMGPLIGKRFHTSVAHLLMGVGVELGADVNLVENLLVGLGLSYVRATMWDLSYDVFLLRVRVGL